MYRGLPALSGPSKVQCHEAFEGNVAPWASFVGADGYRAFAGCRYDRGLVKRMDCRGGYMTIAGRRDVLARKAKSILFLFALLGVLTGLAFMKAQPWLVASVAVIGLLFVFAQQRRPESRGVSWQCRAVTLLYLLSAVGIGMLFPVLDIPFFPEGLVVAILLFSVLGALELQILRRLLTPNSDWFLFDGSRFPFFSLGIAIAISLRLH